MTGSSSRVSQRYASIGKREATVPPGTAPKSIVGHELDTRMGAVLRVRRLPLSCVAAAAVAALAGCATVDVPAVPSQALRSQFGIVAVAPAQYAPQTDFSISWRYKEGATGRQAALTTAGGTAATVVASTAWLGPFGVLTGVLATAAMAIRDAMITSEGVLPASTAEDIESAIDKAIVGLDMQKALTDQLATMVMAEPWTRFTAVRPAGPASQEARPAYAELRTGGVDTVIETAITSVGFDGCIVHDWECRPPHLLHLRMRVQVRLVRVLDGAVLWERSLEYRGGKHELAHWLAGGGRSLEDEFEQGYRALAERIFDEVFLITPIELPYVYNAWESRCWLEPLDPRYRFFHGYPAVTLQPTLRWTAFPRDIDRRKLDAAVLQGIREVTYDLRIWDETAEARHFSPAERWRNRIIYERTGLAAPQHTLEVPLVPGNHYYWSVRARFVVDDRSMATRWATPGRCYSDEVSTGLYEFDTPK